MACGSTDDFAKFSFTAMNKELSVDPMKEKLEKWICERGRTKKTEKPWTPRFRKSVIKASDPVEETKMLEKSKTVTNPKIVSGPQSQPMSIIPPKPRDPGFKTRKELLDEWRLKKKALEAELKLNKDKERRWSVCGVNSINKLGPVNYLKANKSTTAVNRSFIGAVSSGYSALASSKTTSAQLPVVQRQKIHSEIMPQPQTLVKEPLQNKPPISKPPWNASHVTKPLPSAPVHKKPLSNVSVVNTGSLIKKPTFTKVHLNKPVVDKPLMTAPIDNSDVIKDVFKKPLPISRQTISALHRQSKKGASVKENQRPPVQISAAMQKPRKSVSVSTSALKKTEHAKKPWLNSAKTISVKPAKKNTDFPVTHGILKLGLTVAKPEPNLTKRNVAFACSPRSPENPSLNDRLVSWLLDNNESPCQYRHLQHYGANLNSEGDHSTDKPDCIDQLLSPISSNTVILDTCRGAVDLEKRTSFDTVTLEKANSSDTVILDSRNNDEEMPKLRKVLAELNILLQNSFPSGDASEWLDLIYERVPEVSRMATYWLCRARITVSCGGSVEDVVQLVEQGIKLGAEPVQELVDYNNMGKPSVKESALDSTFDAFKISDSESELTSTDPPVNMEREGSPVPAASYLEESDRMTSKSPIPRPRMDTNKENIFNSTVVKFKVKGIDGSTEGTFKSEVKGVVTPLRVTPVRRSHRISNIVDSEYSCMDDIPSELKNRLVMTPNRYLQVDIESSNI